MFANYRIILKNLVTGKRSLAFPSERLQSLQRLTVVAAEQKLIMARGLTDLLHHIKKDQASEDICTLPGMIPHVLSLN